LLASAIHAQGWKLQPSDCVAYETRRVTTKAGKESFGAGAFFSAYGHDLRTATGQFEPASPARADLPRIFGLFWASADGSVKRRIKLRKIIELRCVGTFEIKGDEVIGSWIFKSTGKAEDSDKFRLLGGKARVTARIDVERGVLRSARVDLTYQLKKLEPKSGEKPKTHTLVDDIAVKELSQHGYKGFQKRVNTAIDAGVINVRTLQLKDGSYKPHGKWPVGSTALAVLTLSACDVPRADPAIENALAYMVTQDPKRTYAIGLSLMAFEKAYGVGQPRNRRVAGIPPDRLAWCKKIFERLLAISLPPTQWVYGRHNTRYVAVPDASNTQYGVLGLRAAAALGFDVQEKTWLGVIKTFERFREKRARQTTVSLLREGKGLSDAETVRTNPLGFRYRNNGRHAAWGSMTSAGIACLAIARHELRQLKSSKLREKEVKSMISGGWAWLDQHWGMDRNPYHHGGRWMYYYLYSLERAGILTSIKRVGNRDWYFEGAVQLLARQKIRTKEKDAYWGGEKEHIAETCFALLFLKRATAPLSGGRD
jgi:hypothetical protein